jgi:hypothetical protein
MSILNDILTIIKSSDTVDELKRNMSSKKYTSIATRASEGTLQFPILISDSMDIETAQMIVKALERNYSTFVQTVLSMNSVTNTDDLATYLRQFHQNFNPATNAFSTANIVRTFAESYTACTLENGNVVMCSTYTNTNTPGCLHANKEYNVDLMEDLRTDILNRKFVPRQENLYNFKDADTRRKYNNLLEADVPSEYQQTRDRVKDQKELNKFLYQQQRDNINDQRELNKFTYQQGQDAIKNAKDITDTKLKNRDLHSYALPQQMLKDNDVKKANELIATTMHTRVHMLNSNGEPIGTQDFILGIKGTMHPIKSREMINNVVGACKNNNKVFNFLRWTTGEISFFKDFWLNIPDMKRDIANESNGASRWWIALKNRRDLGKVSSTAFVKDKILPNATIVISAEEAEIIKTHYGYDVTNPYFLKKIMQTYYLLGFVIVDNASQIAHFYFDGASDFESVSFSGLEKENTRDERKFKEMLKVINRN